MRASHLWNRYPLRSPAGSNLSKDKSGYFERLEQAAKLVRASSKVWDSSRRSFYCVCNRLGPVVGGGASGVQGCGQVALLWPTPVRVIPSVYAAIADLVLVPIQLISRGSPVRSGSPPPIKPATYHSPALGYHIRTAHHSKNLGSFIVSNPSFVWLQQIDEQRK